MFFHFSFKKMIFASIMTHTITILIFHLLIFVLLGIIIANIKKAEERKYKQMLEALEEKHRRDMQLPPPTEKTEIHSARETLLLSQLEETMAEKYTDPDFGVDDLADALGISRSSLNRKMRDMLHTTANNYIRDARIEKAEELLRTSSLQINEICYKVGFQTPSYFIKCFRKKYGKSPNEYANSTK